MLLYRKRTSLVKILQSCHFNIFGISCRCSWKMRVRKNNEFPRLLKRLSFLLLMLFTQQTMKFLFVFASKMKSCSKVTSCKIRCFFYSSPLLPRSVTKTAELLLLWSLRFQNSKDYDYAMTKNLIIPWIF